MEAEQYNEIKTLAIIAMFSDDLLMDQLVLKGGNLLDIVYGVAHRSSLDLDFSVEHEFQRGALPEIRERIRRALHNTFEGHGYEAFDVRLIERPEHVTADMASFWGGYRAEFKVIQSVQYVELQHDTEALRRYATLVGPKQKRIFPIDISKFEYCQPKTESRLRGTRIYVYTPTMLVSEKLRALSQQLEEYSAVVRAPSRSPRAPDFFDIYTICDAFAIDLTSTQSRELLRRIFRAKRVPLSFLGLLGNSREYHRPDFLRLKETVKPGFDLKSFDFYFDYVLQLCEALKPLWEE